MIRRQALSLPILALLLLTGTAAAQVLTPPAAGPNGITYYAVPIGYAWDHLSYDSNPGDWNVAVNEFGLDAGEIPENPEFCPGGACPAGAAGIGPSFITHVDDPTRRYTGIPILIGPTRDGFNNVETAHGQAVPVTPGQYQAAFITYSAVHGPLLRPIVLNYSDGVRIISEVWADSCDAAQASPDFFTWIARHRNGSSGPDAASCALITKVVAIDPSRTLDSITIGYDQESATMAPTGDNGAGGGAVLPGDTITSGDGRLVIAGLTLASASAGLPQYGLVTGSITVGGMAQTTPAHAHTPDTGFDVFVLDPPLGGYGAGANVDGSYSLGLPAGTYKLSVVARGGADAPASSGPQLPPVTVVVPAGGTVQQDIAVSLSAGHPQWSELIGTVIDALGNPVAGVAILFSSDRNGPFAAAGISGQGVTGADGAFDVKGLEPGALFVKAASNSSATTAPVSVTLAAGGAFTQNLTVAPLPAGSILGTVAAPDGQFGGIGVPVTLASSDGKLQLSTTTSTMPLIRGSGVVPETGETAQFRFDGLPAGDYSLTVPPFAGAGPSPPVKVTVLQGQTATPALTAAFPAWDEGVADAALSDPFTGDRLAAQWTVRDVGAPMTPGVTREDAAGLTVTADGTGWDIDQKGDQFTFVSEPAPAGDFAVFLTMAQEPAAASSAGLMVRTAAAGMDGSLEPLAGNFIAALDVGGGVLAQARMADFQQTFPFRETATGTDPGSHMPGALPAAPVTLKVRKVGPTLAAFYSTDGGRTQSFIGELTLQWPLNGPLLVGPAVTANAADGSTDSSEFTSFSVRLLSSGTGGGPTCGDLLGKGAVTVSDATVALRIAVGLVMPTATNSAGACGHAINVAFATQVLHAAVFGGAIAPRTP